MLIPCIIMHDVYQDQYISSNILPSTFVYRLYITITNKILQCAPEIARLFSLYFLLCRVIAGTNSDDSIVRDIQSCGHISPAYTQKNTIARLQGRDTLFPFGNSISDQCYNVNGYTLVWLTSRQNQTKNNGARVGELWAQSSRPWVYQTEQCSMNIKIIYAKIGSPSQSSMGLLSWSLLTCDCKVMVTHMKRKCQDYEIKDLCTVDTPFRFFMSYNDLNKWNVPGLINPTMAIRPGDILYSCIRASSFSMAQNMGWFDTQQGGPTWWLQMPWSSEVSTINYFSVAINSLVCVLLFTILHVIYSRFICTPFVVFILQFHFESI